jgi:hypothetical protein
VKAALVSNSGEIAGNDQHIETPLKDGAAGAEQGGRALAAI